MTGFRQEMRDALPDGFRLPEALGDLYDWIEEQGLVIHTDSGPIGVLFPEEELKASWTERGRRGGTNIAFCLPAEDAWLAREAPQGSGRVCVFARTGAEGSRAAFWLDDEDEQQIVHLPSGSGSTMLCVLAESAVDFLRLLAVGYDEVCWSELLLAPAGADPEFVVTPNRPFQDWVRARFDVTIPTRGIDVVPHLSRFGDDHSRDPFWNWWVRLGV